MNVSINVKLQSHTLLGKWKATSEQRNSVIICGLVCTFLPWHQRTTSSGVPRKFVIIIFCKNKISKIIMAQVNP